VTKVGGRQEQSRKQGEVPVGPLGGPSDAAAAVGHPSPLSGWWPMGHGRERAIQFSVQATPAQQRRVCFIQQEPSYGPTHGEENDA